jgi:hypothetical protein
MPPPENKSKKTIILAALAVADDHVRHAEILQHRGGVSHVGQCIVIAPVLADDYGICWRRNTL